MTVQAIPRRAGPYIGTGSVSVYSFGFKTLSETHLRVVQANEHGVESDLLLNSDYTVQLNADQDAMPGGTITLVNGPLLLNRRLTILSLHPYAQTTDVPTGGTWDEAAIENALDKIAIQVQQLDEIASRTVASPPTSGIAPENLLDDIATAVDDTAQHAAQANASAVNAASSAAAAAASATNAATSATAAAGSAEAAAGSATAAAESAAAISVGDASWTGGPLSLGHGGTGASDAAGARTNLGLGTAATANLTTAPTDTTPGRALKVGDFGIGSWDTSRDLTGQVQTGSYRKSVIALCELTNTEVNFNSWSSGRLSFHRDNSLQIEIWADIQIAKIYNTSTPRAELRRNTASTPRVCTFTYNGVKYGGVEFFYTGAEHQRVIWNGVGNFTPFGLDYFDTQNNVALNAEVNNSLNFTEGVISQGNYLTDTAVIPVTRGGTGASDAAGARTNLGVVAGNVPYTPAGTGAVARTVQDKLREVVSVKDFGAVGDGVADDTAALELARNNAKPYVFPAGQYKLSSAFDSQSTPSVGFGAVFDASVPASTLFRSHIDFGKKAIERKSVRAASEYVATPTTYTYIKELVSVNIRHINAAGYQQSYTSDSGGRTSVPAIYIESDHTGYGDCPGVSTHIGVQRHANFASATMWTGMNSGVLYDGSVGAVTGNVNLYGAEWALSDNGNDRVAANGLVLRLKRDNGNPSNFSPYPTVWSGVRAMSEGNFAADTAFYVQGKWHVGLDFSGATLSNNAALALKTNDRIYFGVPAGVPPTKWYADALSNNYMNFDGTKFNFVVNNVPSLQVSQTTVLSSVLITAQQSVNIPSSGNISSTVGAAGTASALPAAPFTYLIIKLDGTNYKIPVYNA